MWWGLLRVPWIARRSNQSNLKEINPEYSLEGLMVKLKLQYSLWPPHVKSQLIGKDPDAEKDWRQEEKGATEDEVVGWHHRLNGHEFGPSRRDSEGQGSLACCSSRGHLKCQIGLWLNSHCKTLLVQLCSHSERGNRSSQRSFEAMMPEKKKTQTLLYVDGIQVFVLTTRRSPTRFLSMRSWEWQQANERRRVAVSSFRGRWGPWKMAFLLQPEPHQHTQIRTNQHCDLAEMDIVMSCLQSPSTWDTESGGFCLQSLTIPRINIHPSTPALTFESQKESMPRCSSAQPSEAPRRKGGKV